MITLLATRHSETDDNANGIIQGQKDSKLSENGFQQVQKLSKSLKDKKIHKIYSSDLSRCGIMTVAIAEYHPECKIVYTTKLRERSLGEFEGQERAVYRKYLADNGLNRVDFEPKDGESFRKFYARCKEFLEELKEEYKDVKEDLNILLSTHSGVIICLHLILNGFEIDELEEKGIHPENASVTVFEILCGSQASVPESLDVQLPSSAGTEACDPHKFPIKKAG